MKVDDPKSPLTAMLDPKGFEVIDEDGPLRALRPSTLANREYQFRSAASALVAAGIAADKVLRAKRCYAQTQQQGERCPHLPKRHAPNIAHENSLPRASLTLVRLGLGPGADGNRVTWSS